MSSRLFLIAGCLLTHIVGWSTNSHRVVARLAASMISSRSTSYFVSRLLPQIGEDDSLEGKMALYSDFADDDSLADPLKQARHFASFSKDKCGPSVDFDVTKDCEGGNCIVTALVDLASKLIDPTSDDTTRSYALMYIIHLVADLHQPLHLGFEENKGGNFFKVLVDLINDPNLTLHEVWDWVVIARGNSNLFAHEYASRLVDRIENTRNFESFITDVLGDSDLDKNYSIDSLTRFIQDIAVETFRDVTCESVYIDSGSSQLIQSGSKLTPKYLEDSFPIAERQLLKAAIRLAFLLESLNKERVRMRDIARVERKLAAVALGQASPQTSPEKSPSDFSSPSWFSGLSSFSDDEEETTVRENPEEQVGSSQGATAEIQPSIFPPREKKTPRVKIPTMVNGINVSKLIIIRDPTDGVAVITTRESMNRHGGKPGPTAGHFLNLHGDHGTQVFRFKSDSTVFRNKDVTPYIFECIYRHMTGDTNPNPRIEHMMNTIVNSIGPLTPCYDPAEIHKAFYDKRDDWFVIRFRPNFAVMTLRSNIHETKSPRVFKFNGHKIEDHRGKRMYLLIDTKIADDQPPESVFTDVARMIEKQTMFDMRRFSTEYPKFKNELDDLYAGLMKTGQQSGALVKVSQTPRTDKPYLASIGYLGRA